MSYSACKLVFEKGFQDFMEYLEVNCNKVADASFASKVTAVTFSSFMLKLVENLTYFCNFVSCYLRNTRKFMFH